MNANRENCLKQIDNVYILTIIAAKRARQIKSIAREKNICHLKELSLIETETVKAGEIALEEIDIQPANFPVYVNVTAKPVTNPDQIREMLYKQLTHPVRWVETIENMISDGVDHFYEVGPGNVLAGLVKRINRNYPVHTKGKFEEIVD